MNSVRNRWFVKNRWWGITIVLFLALVGMMIWSYCEGEHVARWQQFLALTLFVVSVVGVCASLTNIFSLHKKESGITWCQIIILAVICIWILGVIWIFNIQSSSNNTIVFGVIGGLLTLVFQDKIRGVVTFIHLRVNNLLNIGDWIQVPKFNLDGEVRKVTLTTVTVYNWDTTTSTIPISALHADHFINLQNMSEGKTYGWRMLQSYIIDTDSFKDITKEEADVLTSEEFNKSHNILEFLPKEEIKEGAFNAALYRVYLYHWMMKNPVISQQPRLIVRWNEQGAEGGLPLQVYVFIITDSVDDYEWQMSLITEHVAESLEWFGLRLYQRTSSYKQK